MIWILDYLNYGSQCVSAIQSLQPFFCRFQVVYVESGELVHAFTPCRRDQDEELPPSEPPITKMFTSIDGQWLAAINCFGDVYVFNLETLRFLMQTLVKFRFLPLSRNNCTFSRNTG